MERARLLAKGTFGAQESVVREFRFVPLYGNLDREIDRFIDHYQRQKRPIVQFGSRGWRPLMDVFETEDMVVALVELAGVSQEEVDVVIEDRALQVRGQRGGATEHRPRSYHLMEINHGPFERTVALPAKVNPEDAKATIRDGLLEICMPKARSRATAINISRSEPQGDR